MNPEDVKNLVGWLQAIYKETQTTRGAVNDMQAKINMIPEIHTSTHKGTQDSSDSERKIDETRHHMEARLNKVEDTLHDLRAMLQDIQSKVNRLK